MRILESAWQTRREALEYTRHNLRTFLAMREMFHCPFFRDNESEEALIFKKLDMAIDEAIAVECKRVEEIECEYREKCKKYEETSYEKSTIN